MVEKIMGRLRHIQEVLLDRRMQKAQRTLYGQKLPCKVSVILQDNNGNRRVCRVRTNLLIDPDEGAVVSVRMRDVLKQLVDTGGKMHGNATESKKSNHDGRNNKKQASSENPHKASS